MIPNKWKLDILESDPDSPKEDQFWFNSTDQSLRYYDGTEITNISVIQETPSQSEVTLSPFENTDHPLWTSSLKVWEFIGSPSSNPALIADWTVTEPGGDCGNFVVDDGINGIARIYLTDTVVGRYIRVDHGGNNFVAYDSHLAFRVARKAHAGTLSHRAFVGFQFSNPSAYNRRQAGFRADGTGNWYAVSDNNGTEETTDTGISADDTYHWLELFVENGRVTFYIDNIQKAQHTTYTPPGVYGEIVMRGEVLESGTGNKDKIWIEAIMISTPRPSTLL